MLPALLLATTMALAPIADSSGEAALTQAVRGRTAGPAVDCITIRYIRAVWIVDRTAIIYDMIDGTRFVNRPRTGALALDQFATVVANPRTPRLCSIDVVRLQDSASRTPRGFVQLGQFTPYRRDR